jgi:hypothetical protein
MKRATEGTRKKQFNHGDTAGTARNKKLLFAVPAVSPWLIVFYFARTP